jgi:glyoxalase family protein
MRLVKKTVNQDDVGAYHLFYADGEGRPGTDLTFFDWPHVSKRNHGAGTITRTALRVPGASLGYWADRLGDYGVSHMEVSGPGGRRGISFSDPEGQSLELQDDEGRPGGTPWASSPVPLEMGIRGLGGVCFPVKDPRPTARTLTQHMGFRQAREHRGADGQPILVFETGPGGPGAEVHLEVRPDIAYGRVGIGGVHHVAFRTPDDTQHREWQKRLSAAGLGVTPVVDRFYFRSIYFREPGGVLFEIATDGPGFATDESLEKMGSGLALPPFLEPRRAKIEAGLKPITPVAMRAADVRSAPR